MKVVCIKWGNKYPAEYVTRLRDGVARNLPIPYDFICFTENPVDGVECKALPTELPSWWSKLGLFKPGVLEGDILYLDLDVVITDSLLPLVALLYKSPGLWARDDFSYSLLNPRQGLSKEQKNLLGGDGTINSSVMLWRWGVVHDVWNKFTPEVMNVCHGDQNFISQTLGKQRISFIPDEMIGSYKYGQLRGEPIRPIMVFHGSPKPSDLHKSHPLRVTWEAA